MRSILPRAVSFAALLAILLWSALPALAVPCLGPQASEQGQDCPCCDPVALAGAVHCSTACQAAVPVDRELLKPRASGVAAWLVAANAELAGLNPAPADPPPR